MTGIVNALRLAPNLFAGTGVSDKAIRSAEEALTLRFSEEYHEYLSELGIAAVNGHEITGICDSPRLNVVDVTISERIRNPTVPPNWYVVEQANIDYIVVWQSSTGEVYQTTPNAPPAKLCKALCEYLEL